MFPGLFEMSTLGRGDCVFLRDAWPSQDGAALASSSMVLMCR